MNRDHMLGFPAVATLVAEIEEAALHPRDRARPRADAPTYTPPRPPGPTREEQEKRLSTDRQETAWQYISAGARQAVAQMTRYPRRTRRGRPGEDVTHTLDTDINTPAAVLYAGVICSGTITAALPALPALPAVTLPTDLDHKKVSSHSREVDELLTMARALRQTDTYWGRTDVEYNEEKEELGSLFTRLCRDIFSTYNVPSLRDHMKTAATAICGEAKLSTVARSAKNMEAYLDWLYRIFFEAGKTGVTPGNLSGTDSPACSTPKDSFASAVLTRNPLASPPKKPASKCAAKPAKPAKPKLTVRDEVSEFIVEGPAYSDERMERMERYRK